MTYQELVAEIERLKIKNENLELEVNNLRRIVFGSRREYTPITNEQLEESNQCSFFATEKEADENLEKQKTEKIEEYVLNEEEKCPECNGELQVVEKQIVR